MGAVAGCQERGPVRLALAPSMGSGAAGALRWPARVASGTLGLAEARMSRRDDDTRLAEAE